MCIHLVKPMVSSRGGEAEFGNNVWNRYGYNTNGSHIYNIEKQNYFLYV